MGLGRESDEFETQSRLLPAVKLYEMGKLSTGMAAQLAGVTRIAFMFLLSQHSLSAFGGTADELEEDVANAREARRRE